MANFWKSLLLYLNSLLLLPQLSERKVGRIYNVPDTVDAHVRSRRPPDVTPVHLLQSQLCADKVELHLGGHFRQGASSLELAEVVCGSPVSAHRLAEEKAADVHCVTIHPAFWAASLLLG